MRTVTGQWGCAHPCIEGFIYVAKLSYGYDYYYKVLVNLFKQCGLQSETVAEDKPECTYAYIHIYIHA